MFNIPGGMPYIPEEGEEVTRWRVQEERDGHKTAM